MVLDIDSEVCCDQVTIAEHINDFFINVAHKLVETLPKMTDIFSAFSVNCKSLYRNIGLTPGLHQLQVDRSFVLKELKSMKGNKSTGLDKIGPRFLKDVFAGRLI